MKERLENVSLKSIIIEKDSFTWVKKNQEIKINGKLFDVKSYYAVADKIVFIGLYDEDEDLVHEKINFLTSKSKQPSFPIEKLSEIYLANVACGSEYNPTRYAVDKKQNYFFYNEVAVNRPRIFFVPPPNL